MITSEVLVMLFRNDYSKGDLNVITSEALLRLFTIDYSKGDLKVV